MVEDRSAVEYPTMFWDRALQQTENPPVQNVSSAKVQNPA